MAEDAVLLLDALGINRCGPRPALNLAPASARTPAVYCTGDSPYKNKTEGVRKQGRAKARGLEPRVGVCRVHVCGASMGGMIAQLILTAHPERVRSCTILYSCPGPGPAIGHRVI